MNDKQILLGVSLALAALWLSFFVGGVVLPDDWLKEWYGFPFVVTCLFGIVVAMIGGFILGEPSE